MKRSIIAIGVFVVLVAAGLAAWRLVPSSQTYFTDANTIREAAATAPVRDILWEPPVLLDGSINGPGETYEPRLSNDGSTLLFVRGKAGGNADIYISLRTPQSWSEPQPIAQINSPADELGPELSADGASLYFYSNRAGGLGGYDLWVSRRGTDQAWREPVHLGSQVNSQFNDYGPALTADGRMLYFSSNRPPPGEADQPDPNAWSATLREEIHSRTYDLYQVELSESGAGNAIPLTPLNTEYDEGAPAVTAFGDFLYFASDRPGGTGGFDLYRSRRLRGVHQEPINLGSAVNSKHHELDPALSMNGFGLDFSSNRPMQGSVAAATGEYRLYHTNSREVFSDTEYLQRAPIDWAAIWRAVGPNLLWALLALALLLLMLLFFKGAQNRKLSLMAKCVLASLIAHMLLMLLFNVWEVAAAIAGEFQRGGPIKVALMGSSSHAIASQITGSLTEVEQPEFSFASERVALAAESAPPPEEVTHRPEPAEWPEMLRKTQMQAEDSRPRVEFSTSPPTVASVPAAEPKIDLHLPSNEPVAPVSESQADWKPKTIDSTSRTALAADTLVPTPTTTPDIAPQRSTIQASQSISNPIRDSIRESNPSATPLESTPTARFEPALARSNVALAAPSLETSPQAANEVDGIPRLDAAKSMATSRASLPESADLSAPAFASPQPAQSTLSSAPVRLASAPAPVDSSAARSTGSDLPALPIPQFDVEQKKKGSSIALALPDAGSAPAKAIESENTGAFPSPKSSSLARVDVRSTLGAAVEPQVRTDSVEFGRAALDESTTMRSKSIAAEARDSHPVPTQVPANPDSLMASLSPSRAPATIELDLPTEIAPPENPYPQRAAEDRLEHVKRLGGSEQTEEAVELALKWLARHQSSDGRWDADGFDESCGGCGGQTDIAADHALTGLGLLCYLGAGHTHTQPGPYQENVQKAIQWLVARQKSDGDLRGGKETMYTQGIATIALAESYAMSADRSLADPVQRAVGFIYRARNPEAGGWRYDPGQAGDTSVLGWQVMALKSAARAGVSVPDNAFAHARDWLDRVSRKSQPGLYSYQPGETPTPSMTAEALFAQQLLGLAPAEPRMIQSVEYLLDHLPDWEQEAPTYYWYYASLALFQHQGDAWRTWNRALSSQLMEHQRRDGRAAGSWDPSDEWSRLGGRVYQTALCTLMLEVYYRYLPMYGEDALAVGSELSDAPAHEEMIGVIQGRVTERSSRKPIPGAQIRLVLSGRETLTAESDDSGRYRLAIPATPDHFALSASHDGYLPQTVSLERARLEAKQKLTVHFILEPENSSAMATESAPDVHHLGDDRFSGDINSQFQKRSEGASFTTAFEIGPDLLGGPPARAELRMMIKGVQRRHKIYVNNKLLETRFPNAPEDGSFGEFVAAVPVELLVAGSNSLRIAALPSDDDIDDFEFVNIRVYLVPHPAGDRGASSEPTSTSSPEGTQ